MYMQLTLQQMNSPYTWNVHDLVSIAIAKEDIAIRLKKGIEEYVVG